jgi:hypothetical protein
MKQVAFTNSHGEIDHVATPGYDDMYTHGTEYNGNIAHDFDSMFDVALYAKTHWFSASASPQWQVRSEKPGVFHYWENGAWQWNSTLFFDAVRFERDQRLYLCDWTQASDSPLEDYVIQAWQAYRQELRAFPSTLVDGNYNTIEALPWPTSP